MVVADPVGETAGAARRDSIDQVDATGFVEDGRLAGGRVDGGDQGVPLRPSVVGETGGNGLAPPGPTRVVVGGGIIGRGGTHASAEVDEVA